MIKTLLKLVESNLLHALCFLIDSLHFILASKRPFFSIILKSSTFCEILIDFSKVNVRTTITIRTTLRIYQI